MGNSSSKHEHGSRCPGTNCKPFDCTGTDSQSCGAGSPVTYYQPFGVAVSGTHPKSDGEANSQPHTATLAFADRESNASANRSVPRAGKYLL